MAWDLGVATPPGKMRFAICAGGFRTRVRRWVSGGCSGTGAATCATSGWCRAKGSMWCSRPLGVSSAGDVAAAPPRSGQPGRLVYAADRCRDPETPAAMRNPGASAGVFRFRGPQPRRRASISGPRRSGRRPRNPADPGQIGQIPSAGPELEALYFDSRADSGVARSVVPPEFGADGPRRGVDRPQVRSRGP